MKIKENTMKNLQNEINGLKRAKLQDLQVVSLQQKIVESESRLKQQQNLYEAVRTDRNLYSKQLIESQEEIGDMKRKFKIMNHQIEQLKEEITSKDHALVKEHFDHHKVDKEKEILKNELLRIKKQIQSSEQIILNQEQEATKLAKIIQEADEKSSGKLRKLIRLEKELLQEKTKIRALSEELDHPLNVHRWRKLEGSDPKRFEMIRKLQTMQKKLIRKYEETTIKDLLILEKEKLNAQGEANQMKQMEEELQMYKMQVNEYRHDLGQLDKEKQQIQQEWIDRQLKSYRGNATVYGDPASYGNPED
ncbi:hypothetical protein PInf_016974 [Phytophthora infestans]|nr:hypothetical protein PInf_016974 [Phytophthora infestans]